MIHLPFEALKMVICQTQIHTRDPLGAALALARRRGASAVEFAVVAPFFFLLVLGLIEFGRALMVQHMLNNAARIGARVATIEGKANSDVTTAINTAMQSQST